MSTQQAHQRHSQFSQTFKSLSRLFAYCSGTKNLKATKTLHAHLFRLGLYPSLLDIHIRLILSYATCIHTNSFQTLTKFFSFFNPGNPLPFNAFVSHFSQHGFPHLALRTFSYMHFTGVPLDTYTFCSSLTASSSMRNALFGKQMHAQSVKLGWLSSVYVGSALVDLYAKSLVLDDASKVFDEIPIKNTVCANALLSGYAEAEMWDEGLELVRRMHVLCLCFDQFTSSTLVSICAGLSAFELGKQAHANAIRMVPDVRGDIFLQSSLVEMYGKCGHLEKAWHVFNLVGFGQAGERNKDVVLWTSMLGAYARNGQFEEVIRLYKEMLMEGVRPDGVAFLAVISACGHTGYVSLGLEFFESMVHDFGLEPCPEHYSCVVDLLCRAGELEKAWKLVSEIPCKGSTGSANISHSVTLWGALLSACSECRNLELGKLAAKKALVLDPYNVGIYVLLSNLYASFGMWDDIWKLRVLMREKGLKKDVGCSWIEVTK